MVKLRARSLVAVLLVVATLLQWPLAVPSGYAGGGEGRGFGPSDAASGWEDDFDTTDLVDTVMGVEVVGGEVCLGVGQTEGLVSSIGITYPPGHRYDLLLWEATTPGDSRVVVSVLNATEDSQQVGYVNEPIAGYTDLEVRDVSLNGVSPADYPELRLQADLLASGTDTPALLRWAVLFMPEDEWRDDMLGMGKWESSRGLTVASGTAALDLSGASSPTGDYEPYPAVVFSRTSQPSFLDAIYPNAGRTGYVDATAVACTGSLGVTLDDLDLDGDFDLICANSPHGGNDVDSQVYWGSSSGTWSPTGAKDLQTVGAERSATGDFDGDGDVDIIITTLRTSATVDTVVFLDSGGGNYPHVGTMLTQDDPRNVDTGDLDGDGADDIVLAEDGTSRAFMGGPGGPDTTADISFPVGTNCDEVKVRDLDGDGHMDVLFATLSGGKALVFMGGPDGPDTTADYSLSLPGTRIYGCGSGDMDGDGYTDLVFSGSPTTLRVFKGSASGWSDAATHDITPPGMARVVDMVDVDKDGYDDLIAGAGNQFVLYMGGTTWPMAAAVSKTLGVTSPPDMAVAVPKNAMRAFRGTLLTSPITRTAGQMWDILHLEGTFPEGTTTKVTVLDHGGDPLRDLEDLTETDVDISGIAIEDTISVRISFMSETNDTTPVIDSLTVKWMEPMSWREQFYGDAKIERLFDLDITDHELGAPGSSSGPTQLLFPSIRSDDGYDSGSLAFLDAGGLDLLSRQPMTLLTWGVSAAAVADVDGDGYVDALFAVHRTGDTTFSGRSPLLLGTPVGWMDTPSREFPTTGATDVLLEDLNGDGHLDVVFAQEQNQTGSANSILYWGSAEGWNATPDVEFSTSWATGMVAADLDGTGGLDLAFACSLGTTSVTDSMVFLQEAAGFCGTEPSHRLTTRGASDVAAGDIDGDGHTDLAFANRFSAGSVEIDSYVYWGMAGGGFVATPTTFPTLGAEDVVVADLDGDDDLDLAFANSIDNSLDPAVDSFVYLLDGTRASQAGPDVRLPTVGATALAALDLDGTGWMDLAFASGGNGTGRASDSAVFLGGASGWPATPDISLPTVGASDVLGVQLAAPGTGGYMSRPFGPVDSADTGTFHTFSCTATLSGSRTASVQVRDAESWEVLAETALHAGDNEWSLVDAFMVKEHPKVRIALVVRGLDGSGEVAVDDLWVNWTSRVRLPPRVLDVGISAPSVLRTRTVTLWVNVSDEYDPPSDLTVVVVHRLNGTTAWETYLLRPLSFKAGTWTASIQPARDAPIGLYDLRVGVSDSDDQWSDSLLLEGALTVLNNLPTVPEVRLEPARPVSTSTLRCDIVTAATDVESVALSYRYRWYLDSMLVEELTSDTVPWLYLSKGNNWSVEVRAFDGDDEGPPARAWRVVQNAAPVPTRDLPDPEFQEDTSDSDWLNLSKAFEDPDGDRLSWSLADPPVNLTVDIDRSTGRVTLTPMPDWNGREVLVFVASDGELQSSQVVTVTVTPVNDAPTVATVNGQPVTEDPVLLTINQGTLLEITFLVVDKEGDDVMVSLNTSAVDLIAVEGRMTFMSGNDDVGTLLFSLSVWDTDSSSDKRVVYFSVVVENTNDPMGDPSITSPLTGAVFRANQTFSLRGTCADPDVQHGQILDFNWTSNVSGFLGQGSSLDVSLVESGTHHITLIVFDGEFSRTATIDVFIQADEPVEPPPPPNGNGGGDGGGSNWLLVAGIVVALAVLGAVALILILIRRGDRQVAAPVLPGTEAETRRATLERSRDAVRSMADGWEAERGEWSEDQGDAASQPQVGVAPAGPAGGGVIADGWAEMTDDGEAAPAQGVTLDPEDLKRAYLDAIARLPYGIPSLELAGWNRTDLATALATGERRRTADGRELVRIRGQWYHSDVDDLGTFLKQQGA